MMLTALAMPPAGNGYDRAIRHAVTGAARDGYDLDLVLKGVDHRDAEWVRKSVSATPEEDSDRPRNITSFSR